MSTMTTLEALESSLAVISSLTLAGAETPPHGSCGIGLEANMGPADYPMIRLVPSRLTPGRPYGNRTIETMIYFGAQTANSEGLETVYADLFRMEREILSVLRSAGHRYIETITDEDRLDAYKLMVIRCDVVDANFTTHEGTGTLTADAASKSGEAAR